MAKTKRVCVIGLDGANLKIIEILGLGYKGITSVMTSTIPPYTPPAWTSILTGVNPGIHGILGFNKYRNGGSHINNSWDVYYPRLFEMLALHGLKSIIVNVPMSYPFDALIERKNFIVLTDWASPKQTLWPSALHREYCEYLVNPPHDWEIRYDVRDYIKVLENYLKKRMELYLNLFERIDWNLYFIVFSEIDWILHKLPDVLNGRNVALVKPIFNLIKDFINKAIKSCDLTLVVSDHGFEVKRWIVNINAFLHEKNLIKWTYIITKDTKFRKFIKINSGNTSSAKLNMAIGKFTSSMYKHFPKRLYDIFRRKLPLVTAIDVSSSPAFMAESGNWGLYTSKPKFTGQVINLLNNFTGIKRILKPEDLFHGPHTRHFPNLILVPQNGFEIADAPYGNVIERTLRGGHEVHGVFIAIGDEVNYYNFNMKTVSVYDVTPTILYYLNMPPSKEQDGKTLKEIFNTERPQMKVYDYLTRFNIARVKEKLLHRHSPSLTP
jgi:predicted AlkP superfamily phosphohydrolase/phosphomutase